VYTTQCQFAEVAHEQMAAHHDRKQLRNSGLLTPHLPVSVLAELVFQYLSH